MTTFHEQMKKLRDDNEYRNVFPNDKWTLQDYKDIFWCIDEGYLVQDCGESFMINEEWEGDDIYAKEFLNDIGEVEEEEEVEFNGDKMDNILNPDGLDWSFDKPTEGDYHTIYIIKKVEEEEEVELKEYNGVMLPKYINGREVLCYPNAGRC